MECRDRHEKTTAEQKASKQNCQTATERLKRSTVAQTGFEQAETALITELNNRGCLFVTDHGLINEPSRARYP